MSGGKHIRILLFAQKWTSCPRVCHIHRCIHETIYCIKTWAGGFWKMELPWQQQAMRDAIWCVV